MFKYENTMPYDNNILLNHLKKMVFNTCNKWKSYEKKGAFSAVIVSSGIKMENVQYNKKKKRIGNQGNTQIYYTTQTMDYFTVRTGR